MSLFLVCKQGVYLFVELSQVIVVDLFAAERADILGFHPLLDTLRVEVVLDVA